MELREAAGRPFFSCPFKLDHVRESGAGDDSITVRGHAAVFNHLSRDLGGFKEKIAPGAFSSVLDRNPDVHLVNVHDWGQVLARTKNGTLELREDPMGLHFWARMAPTTYAQDLAILMQRGDVDQCSFRFMIEREEWAEDEDGNITATILQMAELFEVTICPQGAYPQTDASLVVAHSRDRLADALRNGRVPGREQVTENPARSSSEAGEGDAVAERDGSIRLDALKLDASARLALARAK